MYLCKFGKIPFTGIEDNARKRSYTDVPTDANGIRIKTNMPPFGVGHKNKFAYIFKSEVCSHDIFTFKFAHGV